MSRPALAPETTLASIRLRVADLPRMQDFYETVIGLTVESTTVGVVRLGAAGRSPIVELVGDPTAPERPRRTTGLFHLAILVPSRPELARAIDRVAGYGWRFSGGADHLVSEAMYLADPEGNGIELYRDRPREEWKHTGGEVAMDTLPIDLDGVMSELPADTDRGMAPDAILGHVHLNVADLDTAEAFWGGVIGFDVVARSYPGALFVSAGGYHHHVGLNTWAGVGAPRPPSGARGLDRFGLRVSSEDAAAIRDRAEQLGLTVGEGDEGIVLDDLSGNRVLVATG